MKHLRYAAIGLLGLLAVMSFNGCFEYPEGPVFTLQLKDERLEGTWLVKNVTDPSGADVTAEHSDETLTVVVNRSGDRAWATFKNGLIQNHGTYQYGSHSDYIIIIFDVFNQQNTTFQVFYTIRKLTEKEFKYIDDQGYTYDLKKY